MQAAREFRTAIRFDSLNRRVVFFAGTDTNHARDIKTKILPSPICRSAPYG